MNFSAMFRIVVVKPLYEKDKRICTSN